MYRPDSSSDRGRYPGGDRSPETLEDQGGKDLLERRGSHVREAPRRHQSQDDGDQAVSSTLETLRNSIQDTEYVELVMIESALQSIADGRYGICQDCEQEISEKRLKYYPNAQRCLTCQEAAEITSF